MRNDWGVTPHDRITDFGSGRDAPQEFARPKMTYQFKIGASRPSQNIKLSVYIFIEFRKEMIHKVYLLALHAKKKYASQKTGRDAPRF